MYIQKDLCLSENWSYLKSITTAPVSPICILYVYSFGFKYNQMVCINTVNIEKIFNWMGDFMCLCIFMDKNNRFKHQLWTVENG